MKEKVSPKRQFRGQTEDEEIILLERKHPFFLILSLFPPALILFVALSLGGATVIIRLQGSSLVGLLLPVLLLSALMVLITLAWLLLAYLEWENDQYILTTRRVIALRRIFRFFEERREAELGKIQEVTTTVSGPWAYLLGYADITISTAALGGRIEFPRIGHAERMKEAIFRQQEALRAEEMERRRADLKERLKEGLGYL